MSYELIFTKAFDKDLGAISKKSQKDLRNIVYSIENILLFNPFSTDTKQLECFRYYRYRVGKYRIVFDFNDENKIILLAVDDRSSIYGKLKKRFNRC
jgi:mRNA interferase RelE/StbE